MMNKYILKITDHSFFHHWQMLIDMYQINEDAGRKERDRYTGRMISVYPISKVKKIFKFANQYGDPEDLTDMDVVIWSGCPRIKKYWEDAKKWRR